MLRRTAMLVALATVFFSPAHNRTASAADNPLQGAWQVMDASGQTAGLYIFTGTHYSMMIASTGRPDIANVGTASADEVRALYDPMLANSGVYEVAGNLVTIRPIAAKIPVVMKPGAYEVYSFRIEDKTLSLTQQRNVRGPVQGGATRTLVRVE